MTKATELRELNDAELIQQLAEAQARSTSTSGSSRRPASSTTARGIGDIRREVARINTLLREREIAAAEQQEA